MLSRQLKNSWLFIVMLFVSATVQAQILDVEIPESQLLQQVGWVNDFEDVLTDEEEEMLSKIISAYEVETSIEIVLVTLPENVVAEEKLFDTYTFKLAHHWQVGKAIKNNGVLIGFSTAYKKIRINNGYGIEDVLSDVETQAIIKDYFVPHFKKGEYYEGSRTGIERLMNILRLRMKE